MTFMDKVYTLRTEVWSDGKNVVFYQLLQTGRGNFGNIGNVLYKISTDGALQTAINHALSHSGQGENKGGKRKISGRTVTDCPVSLNIGQSAKCSLQVS